MRTTLHIIFTTCVAIVGLSSGACEGPVGPEGSQGEQGVQGPEGPPGEDGNANVYSTGWEVIEATDWRFGVGVGSVLFGAYEDIDCCFFNEFVTFGGLGVPDSDHAEENAVVLAYVGFTNNDGAVNNAFLIPLKRRVSGGGGSGGVEFRMAYNSGGGARWIIIAAALTGGSWNQDFVRNEYLPGLRFRVVVIPPELAAPTAGFDYSDYEAVAEYLRIAD